MVWLAALLIQDAPPPKLDFETLAKAEAWLAEGHFRTPPPPLKEWIGRWVTIEGFFFVTFDGELKDAFVSSQWSDPSKGIIPTKPFERVRIEFRDEAVPEDLQTRWAGVSGVFGLRRVERDGELVALFNLSDAVEGARRPPPRNVPTDRISFSLLETARAVASGEDLEARPYDVASMGPIPAPIQAFHGRWITITGNLFVPYPADKIKRFILAKNPWDGCCFGVPPTVWDSIVVALKDDAPLAEPYPRILRASGRFHVQVQRDPRTSLVTHCFELQNAVIGAHPEPTADSSFPYGTAAAGTAVLLAVILGLLARRNRRRNSVC